VTPRKLHLLVVNQFFWPDTAATGQLLMDVSRAVGSELARTTAICAESDYGIKDTTARPPVRILRSRVVRFSRATIGRLLSYAAFILGAVWNGFRIGRPDVILTLTTPPLTSVFGHIVKLMRGCSHFIWEMDVYPDIAVDLGVLKRHSILTGIIGALADWSRRNADGIIVLGDDMKARLIHRGIPETKIFVAENWADGREIIPRPFPEGPFVVHYSGTLGLSHDVDTIAAALSHLRDDPRFRFVFAGGGARRKYLENYCAAHIVPNVTFQPYCSRAELGASLAEGHVGLVTQLPQTCGSVVPSKTYGIMAAGRPILYIGPPDSTPAHIIHRFRCGWRIDPGDVEGLVQLLHRLQSDPALVRNAGRNAREAFEQHYDLPIGVRRITDILGLNATHVFAPLPRPDRVRSVAVPDSARQERLS